jgi:hypothetical protein
MASNRSLVAGRKDDYGWVLTRLREREQEPVAQIIHDGPHAVLALVFGHVLEHVDEPAEHFAPDVPLTPESMRMCSSTVFENPR